MPYTRPVLAYLASLEKNTMIHFHVIDPEINASHGKVSAASETEALNYVVGKMGWASYEDYRKVAANHPGTRTLKAVRVVTHSAKCA